MNSDCVVAVIYVGKQVWDCFIIQYNGISLDIETLCAEKAEKNYSCGDVIWSSPQENLAFLIDGKDGRKRINPFKLSVQMNGHALSYFVKLLKVLCLYRKLVMQHLKNKHSSFNKSSDSQSLILLRIRLMDVDQQIIDKIWNRMISHSIAEYSELEHAMSWLSTLGGAFSALGDYYLRCAQTAGEISLQQWRIALRLGDPNTVARCRLFSALSLMQTGRLRAARLIIWRQYQAIKTGRQGLQPDTRLVKMCFGCWAKLRYEYQQRRFRKQNPKALHWKQ